MKNKSMLFGIMALCAVIALGLIACGDLGLNDDPLGTISIQTHTDGPYIGKELTAVYSGEEEVTYQWKKGETAITGATSAKYTPTEVGFYKVTVSFDGNSKTSASIGIYVIYYDILGYWKFTGAEANPQWKVNGVVCDEELCISEESFGLSNTFKNDGSGKETTAPGSWSDTGTYEFLSFFFNGATEITPAPAQVSAGYTKAFKLDITYDDDLEYDGWKLITSVTIYLKDDNGTMSIRRTNPSGVVIEREYKKHEGSIFFCKDDCCNY